MVKALNIGNGWRFYRAVAIGDRWQKSEFEYFHVKSAQWRRVNNWNSREILFGVM